MIISRPAPVSLFPCHAQGKLTDSISRRFEVVENAVVTSLATSAGFLRRAKTKESTPFGFLKVSKEINVTCTFDI